MAISDEGSELYVQLKSLLKIKEQYADLNVANHEIATKLAQSYLEKKHSEIESWQSNPRAGAGLDISGYDSSGLRVVAEITAHHPIQKTTTGKPRFGAQQEQRMREIVNKLLREKQAVKYLSVITDEARIAVADEIETSEICVMSLFDLCG